MSAFPPVHPVYPVHIGLLNTIFNNEVNQGVDYEMGAKAPSLGVPTTSIHRIDCSGEVRYLDYRASDGKLILPDGSAIQHDWCEAQHQAGKLYKLTHYADVQYAKNDASRLFICFIAPGAEGRGSAGHVWLVWMGQTLESHGGAGCDSRPWNTPVLLNHCCAAYELPTAA